MSKEIALECVKLAATLVSPSVADRVEAIAQTSKRLYSHIKILSGETPEEVLQADKPRRGRPPKPCEV